MAAKLHELEHFFFAAKVINGLLLPRHNQEKTAEVTKQAGKLADLKKKLAALEPG